MRWLLGLAQRILVGHPRVLARKAGRKAWLAGDREARRFAAQLATRPSSNDIPFGHVRFRDGTDRSVGLPRKVLRESHLAVSGATGSGKTTCAVGFVDRVLDDPAERLVGVDPKGDFTSSLREKYFPARAAGAGGERFASRVRYLWPFAPGPPPPLRLTQAEPGVAPSVQAISLATSLVEATGVEMSLPTVQAFTKLARLAIEFNEPLTALVQWIARPVAFARLARRSQDGELRHYALHEFPHEHRGVMRALRARIEAVLLLPSVRASLEAPTCIDLGQALEEWHLLVNLANPPAGEEAAVRMLGGPIIGRLTRAILNRRLGSDAPHLWLAVDELQEVLGRFEATSVDRLMALCRSKRVSILTINQHSAQLPRKLRDAIRTNAAIELYFRASESDAQVLSTVLPVPADAERPGEARRALVRQIMGLQRRQAALWVKTARIPLGFISVPKVDFADLERRAERLSTGAREQLGGWSDAELVSPSATESSQPSSLTVPGPLEAEPPPDPPAIGFPNLG